MAKKPPPPAAPGGFSALAEALRARGLAPSPSATPERVPVEVQPEPPPAAPAEPTGRLTVRKETKGRGGKTVTTIQRLPLRGAARDSWIAKLKSRLGTGASLDGDLIVVQGDHVARILTLLQEDGL